MDTEKVPTFGNLCFRCKINVTKCNNVLNHAKKKKDLCQKTQLTNQPT